MYGILAVALLAAGLVIGYACGHWAGWRAAHAGVRGAVQAVHLRALGLRSRRGLRQASAAELETARAARRANRELRNAAR